MTLEDKLLSTSDYSKAQNEDKCGISFQFDRIWTNEDSNTSKQDAQIKSILPFQNEEVLSLAVYHLGESKSWIFIGKADSIISAFDMNTLEKKLTLKGHTDGVNRLVVYNTANQPYLISNSENETASNVRDRPAIIIWELPSGVMYKKLYCPVESIGMEVFLLRRLIQRDTSMVEYSGDVIVNACADGTINVWDILSGDKLFTIVDSLSYNCRSMAFCIYGDSETPLLSVGSSDSASVWNLSTSESVCRIKGSFDRTCAILADINTPMLFTDNFKVYDMLSGKVVTTKSFNVDTSFEVECCTLKYTGDHDFPYVFLGMTDGSVTMYNFETCAKLATLSGHSSSVLAVAFDRSASSFSLITGGIDNRTHIWNRDISDHTKLIITKTIDPDRRGGHAGEVFALQTAVIDGISMLFSGGQDSVVIQWNLDTNEEIKRFKGKHVLQVNSICVVMQSKSRNVSSPMLVTAGEDKMICVWDIPSGKLSFTLPKEHTLGINEINIYSWSPQPLGLVSISDDKNVIFWDLHNHEDKVLTYESDHTEPAYCMQSFFYLNKGYLLTGGADATAKFCVVHQSAMSGNKISVETKYSWNTSATVHAVLLHVVDNECRFCFASSKHSVYIWSAVDGSQLRLLVEPIVDPKKASAIRSLSIFTSPQKISDNDLMLVVGRGEGIVSIWDVATGYRVRSLVGGHTATTKIRSTAIAMADNDRYPLILSGGTDKRICKWSLNSPASRYKLEADMTQIYWIKLFQPINSSNTMIIVASSDGYLRLFDSTKHKILYILNIPEVLSIASYNCSTIAISTAIDGINPIIVTSDSSQSTYIWNFQTQLYYEIRGDYVACMDKGLDTILLTHSDGDRILTQYDIYTGQKLRSTVESEDDMTGHMAIYQLAESPKPKAVVGTRLGRLLVFDLTTGANIRKLEGHNRTVYYVKANYDTDTPLLASFSEDCMLIVWHLSSFDKLNVLSLDMGYFSDIHVFPDKSLGLLYLTSGQNPSLDVYNPFNGSKLHELSVEKSRAEEYQDDVADVLVLSSGNDLSDWKLVAGTYNGQLKYLEYNSSGDAKLFKSINSGHADEISCIDFYGCDETLFAVSASYDGSVVFWDTKQKKISSKIRCSVGLKGILSLAIINRSNGSTYVVMGCISKTAAIWDLQTNELVATLINGHTDEITSVISMNSTGNDADIIIFTASKDKTVRYWNLEGNLLPIILQGEHKEAITCMIHYSTSDGYKSLIAATGSADKSIILWDIPTGKMIMRLQGGHTKGITNLDILSTSDGSQNIISVGKDAVAAMWDAATGSLLRKFEGGHIGTIKALTVFQDKQSSLLATGGKDGFIAIWSAETGELLQKFKVEGKENKKYVGALSFEKDRTKTDDLSKNPKLYIGNSSGNIEVREIYLGNFLPTSKDVSKAFENDVNNEDNEWTAFSGLSKRYSHGLWLENLSLYKEAIELDRVDFFQQFRSYLVDTIHRASYAENLTLLRLALQHKNGPCVKILLSCWSEALQRPCNDIGDQICWHPALSIRQDVFKSDLLLLAKVFPSHFSEFLCSLSLVPNILTSTTKLAALPSSSRYILKCANDFSESVFSDISSNALGLQKLTINEKHRSYIDYLTNIISIIFPVSYTSEIIYEVLEIAIQAFNRLDPIQPATSMIIPIRDLASIELLQAMVDVSNLKKSVDLFDCDAGVYALRCAWGAFGSRCHILAMIEYIIFVISFSAAVLSFQSLSDSDSISVIAWILQAIVLVFMIIFVYEEGGQIASEVQGTLTEHQLMQRKDINLIHTVKLSFIAVGKHCTNIWNIIDLIVIGLCSAGTIVRFAYWRETLSSRIILSIASVFVYFKILYFLRPFEKSGPLGNELSMILYTSWS